MRIDEANSLKGFFSNRTTPESTLANMLGVLYEIILHTSYSPDLDPSDFPLTKLEKNIRRRHFQSDKEVMAAAEEWVYEKDPDCFSSRQLALEVYSPRGKLHRNRRD